MKTLTGCPHVRYAVEPNGRVVVQTLTDGVVNESRRYRNMKAAHKALERHVYCGRRGAAFLGMGDKNRSMDLLWAQSRLNGLKARR